MVTEIREFGDKATVVVYTDETGMASKLAQRRALLKTVEYEQEQKSKKRVALIGKDFYFPKKELKRLLKTTGLSKEMVFS